MNPLHAIAAQLKRDPKDVAQDFKLVEAFADPVNFAEALFSKGEGWLHAGLPLAAFQQKGLRLLTTFLTQLALIWPRGHLKTTLLKLFVIYTVCYKKASYIVVLTSTDKNKRGHSFAIRSAFQDAFLFPEFHWLLPYWFDGKAPIVKANDNEIVFSNGVRVEFLSVGGEIRGLNAQGRPDLILLDDIIPSEAATSDAERERITNIWFSVIRFIGAVGAKFAVFGTILHKDDLVCQIAEGRIGGWEVQRLRACDDNFDNVLWPERWTGAALKKVYEDEYVKAGKAHLFAREMFNDPATGATHPFGNVVFARRLHPNPATLYKVVSIDHAAGTGGDDFAIRETGEDENGVIYLLAGFLSNQITLPQKLAAVETFIRRRRPQKLVCGRTSESMTFIEVMRDHLKNCGLTGGFFIEEPTEVASKNDRIRAWLEPRYQSGTIVHPFLEGADDTLRKTEASLRNFDVTTDRNYDDPIDVLARCVEYSRKATPQTVKDVRPADKRAAEFWDKMHGKTSTTNEPEYRSIKAGNT